MLHELRHQLIEMAGSLSMIDNRDTFQLCAVSVPTRNAVSAVLKRLKNHLRTARGHHRKCETRVRFFLVHLHPAYAWQLSHVEMLRMHPADAPTARPPCATNIIEGLVFFMLFQTNIINI